MQTTNPKPWPLISSKEVAEFGLFAVRELCATSPRTGLDLNFHVIDLPDLLQVVPLTVDGDLLMIRQFRHGNRRIGLEFPGGLLDAQDSSPAAGALRELQEETGYTGGNIWPLGELGPLPALTANRCLFFLSTGVVAAGGQNLDAGEDIEVVLVKPAAFHGLIANGEINNMTSVAALALAQTNPAFREFITQ